MPKLAGFLFPEKTMPDNLHPTLWLTYILRLKHFFYEVYSLFLSNNNLLGVREFACAHLQEVDAFVGIAGIDRDGVAIAIARSNHFAIHVI